MIKLRKNIVKIILVLVLITLVFEDDEEEEKKKVLTQIYNHVSILLNFFL